MRESRTTRKIGVSALLLLTAGLFFACSLGEGPSEVAERLGEIDIDPQQTLGSLKVLTGQEPVLVDSTIRNLSKALFGGDLVELWFYGTASKLSDGSTPVEAVVRAPFKGSLLGVRLGDDAGMALSTLRQRFPGAYLLEPARRQDESPLRFPGEIRWTIVLDDHRQVIYWRRPKLKRGKPVRPPVYRETLQLGDCRYELKSGR